MSSSPADVMVTDPPAPAAPLPWARIVVSAFRPSVVVPAAPLTPLFVIVIEPPAAPAADPLAVMLSDKVIVPVLLFVTEIAPPPAVPPPLAVITLPLANVMSLLAPWLASNVMLPPLALVEFDTIPPTPNNILPPAVRPTTPPLPATPLEVMVMPLLKSMLPVPLADNVTAPAPMPPEVVIARTPNPAPVMAVPVTLTAPPVPATELVVRSPPTVAVPPVAVNVMNPLEFPAPTPVVAIGTTLTPPLLVFWIRTLPPLPLVAPEFAVIACWTHRNPVLLFVNVTFPPLPVPEPLVRIGPPITKVPLAPGALLAVITAAPPFPFPPVGIVFSSEFANVTVLPADSVISPPLPLVSPPLVFSVVMPLLMIMSLVAVNEIVPALPLPPAALGPLADTVRTLDPGVSLIVPPVTEIVPALPVAPILLTDHVSSKKV